jgi:outer membrane protein, heavy metal efflux system
VVYEGKVKLMNRKVIPLLGVLLCCGCLYPGYKKADQAVCEIAAHPFDVSASDSPSPTGTSTEPAGKPASNATSSGAMPPEVKALLVPTDVRTATLLQRAEPPADSSKKFNVNIPAPIPASDTPLIQPFSKNDAERAKEVQALYPPLPKLPEEPRALPGPDGHPYTLQDLQRLAAENSPTLRQAASDVVAAEGNLIQAQTYPNPTVGFQANPSNDASTPGNRALYLEQLIKTAGKIGLAAAAAKMDLDNAHLALKRARSDLATAVRNAYFALLVSRETVRVTRAMAEFTDDVYRLFEHYLEAGQAAAHEPAALEAQAHQARLAYKQAIQNYVYNWEQLRAALGLRLLPLTEVAGRIDACIPYYDYSVVLNHVLQNHTDVKVAYNGIEKARYLLKSAQVVPIPDIDVSLTVQKEMVLPPFQWVSSVQCAIPIPIWNQNRGNILAAQGGLIRAQEEPHRVEAALTGALAGNYANYKLNLEALESYRKYILPAQVRVYRGVFTRRAVDQNAPFSDLVGAQQNLAASVTQYLATLGTLWSSVISVADQLQTDDLFQLATPMEVEPIPDLLHLAPLPCSHCCAQESPQAVPAPSHFPAPGPLMDQPRLWVPEKPSLLAAPPAPVEKPIVPPDNPPPSVPAPSRFPAPMPVGDPPRLGTPENPYLLPEPAAPVDKSIAPPRNPPTSALAPLVPRERDLLSDQLLDQPPPARRTRQPGQPFTPGY